MTTPKLPVTKPTKAIVTAVGTSLTALTTMWATVSVAASDDVFDAGEVGTMTTALITLGLTVWAVWRVPNRPVETDETSTYTRRNV